MKVLLPDVFLNIFTATQGFQMILPVTEDSQSKSRTIFSLSPNHCLRNLELTKAGFERSEQNRKKGSVDDSVSTCCVLWLAI